MDILLRQFINMSGHFFPLNSMMQVFLLFALFCFLSEASLLCATPDAAEPGRLISIAENGKATTFDFPSLKGRPYNRDRSSHFQRCYARTKLKVNVNLICYISLDKTSLKIAFSKHLENKELFSYVLFNEIDKVSTWKSNRDSATAELT